MQKTFTSLIRQSAKPIYHVFYFFIFFATLTRKGKENITDSDEETTQADTSTRCPCPCWTSQTSAISQLCCFSVQRNLQAFLVSRKYLATGGYKKHSSSDDLDENDYGRCNKKLRNSRLRRDTTHDWQQAKSD